METKVTVREVIISILMMISYAITGVGILMNKQNLALVFLVLSALFSVWMLYEIVLDADRTLDRLAGNQANLRNLEIPDRPIEKIDKKVRRKKEVEQEQGNTYIQSRLSDYDNIDFEINDEGISTSVVKDFRQVKAEQQQHVTIATAKQQAIQAAKETEEAAKKAKANVVQASNLDKITETVQKRQEQEKREAEVSAVQAEGQQTESTVENETETVVTEEQSSEIPVSKSSEAAEEVKKEERPVQKSKKTTGKKGKRGKNSSTQTKAAPKKRREKQKFVPDFQPEVYSDFEKNYATDGDDSYLYDGIIGDEGVGNMRVYKRGEEIQYHSDED